MDGLDVLSFVVAGGQIATTVLLGYVQPYRRGPAAALTAWAVLFGVHVTLVAFGFVGDYAGFKYLQPVMIPLTASSFWMTWRAARQRTERSR